MIKLFNFAKILFFPKFTYIYYTALINTFEGILKKVEMWGGEIVENDDKQVSFYIKSSKVFGRLSFGKVFFHITRIRGEKYRVEIQFFSYKLVFYTVVIILSAFTVVISIATASLLRLSAIPIILISGHLLFWGMLPSKVNKLKRILIELSDT